MPRGRLTTYLVWLGNGLSLLAVVFVVGKLWDYGHEVSISFLSSLSFPLFFLALVFGAVSVILALAWRDLLRHFGLPIAPRLAIRIYGLSQFSKYVPGNVFQFAGRQALGLAAGLPMWPLAKSAVWEIGMLALVGCLFLGLVLPYHYAGVPVPLVLACFPATVLMVGWAAYRWFGRWIAGVVGWYTVMLTLSGLVFLAVLWLVVPERSLTGASVIMVCGAYVTAWLAGLVTPGAPAGMGIRELVLYAVLQSAVTEPDLLAAIVLGRLVTLGGDVTFFLLALTIKAQDTGSA